MHKWGMLAVGLCVSGVLFAALADHAAANPLPEEGSALQQSVELPHRIKDTQMVIRELAVYEGPFPEDGSGEEVADVLALVIENTGGTTICQGEIVLQTDRGLLEFSLSWLPPDAVALVMEKNRAPAGQVNIGNCYGWNTTIYPEMTGAVTAREQGMGSLIFTNHTTQMINGVEAVYKSFDTESGMYIGGSSGTVVLKQLQPGEARIISPYRYASGYSKVVCMLLTVEEDG